LKITGTDKIEDEYFKYGIGRMGTIAQTTLEDLARDVKEHFGLQSVRLVGERTTTIKKVAIVGGSGAEF